MATYNAFYFPSREQLCAKVYRFSEEETEEETEAPDQSFTLRYRRSQDRRRPCRASPKAGVLGDAFSSLSRTRSTLGRLKVGCFSHRLRHQTRRCLQGQNRSRHSASAAPAISSSCHRLYSTSVMAGTCFPSFSVHILASARTCERFRHLSAAMRPARRTTPFPSSHQATAHASPLNYSPRFRENMQDCAKNYLLWGACLRYEIDTSEKYTANSSKLCTAIKFVEGKKTRYSHLYSYSCLKSKNKR